MTAPSFTLAPDGTVTVFVGYMPTAIGTVKYADGFGRYVAHSSTGKVKQFTQSERESGLTTANRAARWVVRQYW